MVVPENTEEIVEMIRQLHELFTERFGAHIDGSGHMILPLQETEDIILGKKFMDILGERGATYYLRRIFNPEKVPNWASNNEEIMEAFYHKNSIKLGGTITAIKCGSEWVADAA